ncbi:MAG TPA: PP2C family protein-serine/threonine phosphatase [Thermoanaerobaculia bacterium]|jgi:sigma-B regulation protein RsbU (phosphoserine phosphatase)|nr:PP2C family protein-serine/threonine phosphatase [Thermoanaerobaculia bacterium]
MEHTAAEVIAVFHRDMTAGVIAAVLITMGIGMLLLGALTAGRSRRSFVYTGLFAIAYGARLAINTEAFTLLYGHPRWLDYVRSDFEYLVPIPAALLFETFSGNRRPLVHRIITFALVACAAVAIPYEVAVHSPFALKPVIDALVIVLIAVLAIDLLSASPDSGNWSLVRIGALVFAAFVLNEHFRFVGDPYGVTREPTGFLILMLTIIVTTMRHATQSQQRLAVVDSELATARKIQLAALPRKNPELRGLEVAAVYTPASDVAGDFYDFLELDRGCLGVFIADVSGHGVPAALVASMLKIALATQSENASSPARVLANLNALFFGRLERQFITAAYVHIDPIAGILTTASAGHPPPILLHGETCDEIIAPGVVLGRFRDARYEEVSRPFVPGDTLVLYTDGVTETSNRNAEIWGDERLRTTIAAKGANSAAELAAKIIAEVQTWRGVTGPPEDDVTLIVVQRT